MRTNRTDKWLEDKNFIPKQAVCSLPVQRVKGYKLSSKQSGEITTDEKVEGRKDFQTYENKR